MKRKIFSLILCGILALVITGCENNETTTNKNSDANKQEESTNNSAKEESKTLQVGDYEIKYGFYKSKQVSVLKIMEDGKCTYSAVDCTYYVDGNHIIMEGQTKGTFRVENETTLINDSNGNDIDTLYYYEVE